MSKFRHHIKVRIEFNLTWTIKDQKSIITKLRHFVNEPFKVLYQILHAVYEASIRTKAKFFLDIFKTDKVSDIYVAPILEDLCSRV